MLYIWKIRERNLPENLMIANRPAECNYNLLDLAWALLRRQHDETGPASANLDCKRPIDSLIHAKKWLAYLLCCERSQCEWFRSCFMLFSCTENIRTHVFIICVGKWQMWINQLKIGMTHIKSVCTCKRNYICNVSLRSVCAKELDYVSESGWYLGGLNVFFCCLCSADFQLSALKFRSP